MALYGCCLPCHGKTGDWDHPALAGITLERLQEKGYMRLKVGTPESYAPHAQGNFPTPSGKCEFRSSLAANGNFVLSLFRQGSEEFQAGEPVDPLPTYIPPNESPTTSPELAQKYPLNLLSPKSHALLNSSYGNLPEQLRHAGEQTVLLHPQDASARGITDAIVVRVFNDRGAFEAVAEITDDVMPGVVVAPLGRRLSRSQATVQAVNSSKYADLGRAPTVSDNLVEVALVPASQHDRSNVETARD